MLEVQTPVVPEDAEPTQGVPTLQKNDMEIQSISTRVALHEVYIGLSVALIGTKPGDNISTQQLVLLRRAESLPKLLWEANRGY